MTDSRSSTQADYAERILRVLVHVQHNLDAAMSLDDLASIAHFSPFHFHRVFRGLVGESVQQHIRRLRLERAAMRLKHTDRPITSIAFEAGYEAHESFTRAFHRAFGRSPRDFRTASKLATQINSRADVHYVSADDEHLSFAPVQLEDTEMNVGIKRLEPMRIAFIRHTGPYDEVGATWERLMDWVGRECLFGPDVRFFGMCWDDPEVTPPEKIRYDACVTIDETVTPSGDIGVQELIGGKYAVALHEGAYDKLNDTYSGLLGQWFPERGCEPGDPPSLEFYLNDPNSTEPEDLLTEVCMPIEKGA